ncbi:MAG: hypothetical protein PHO37_18280 [Kiritimatiellae bacterium]|nr:hypothetical protein [Kiritimatiellia bacterium]
MQSGAAGVQPRLRFTIAATMLVDDSLIAKYIRRYAVDDCQVYPPLCGG